MTSTRRPALSVATDVPGLALVAMGAYLATAGQHFAVRLAVSPTGLLLIIAVDHFLDMGRSATNVLGNSVATVAVAKWEGQLSTTDQRLDHVGTVPSPAE